MKDQWVSQIWNTQPSFAFNDQFFAIILATGKKFYVLVNGSVAIIKKNVKENKTQVITRITYKSFPCYFGEQAMVNDKPRGAGVVCDEKLTVLLVLSQSQFSMFMDCHPAGPKNAYNRMFGGASEVYRATNSHIANAQKIALLHQQLDKGAKLRETLLDSLRESAEYRRQKMMDM